MFPPPNRRRALSKMPAGADAAPGMGALLPKVTSGESICYALCSAVGETSGWCSPAPFGPCAEPWAIVPSGATATVDSAP